MTKFIVSLFTFFAFFSTMSAQQTDSQKFFELPIVPDSIQSLQRRCDYMLTHYWDFCDLKKSFSARDKMADAFDLYLTFMPYASADVVFKSVDDFISRISKKAEDVDFVASMAEAKIYSDSAEYQSEQLYQYIIDGLLKTKKMSKEMRPYYEKQSRILANSREGVIMPAFDYVGTDGLRHSFQVDPANMMTVVMFVTPGETDSNMARLRLSADIKTNELINAGRVKIACITVDKSDTPLPETTGWLTGYGENIADQFVVKTTPTFYLLDSGSKIVKRDTDVEPLLNVMQLLRAPRKKAASTEAAEAPQE